MIAAAAILRTLGQVGLSLLLALVNGKTVKRLLIKPLVALVRKTKTSEDDKIVESVAEDWGVPEAIETIQPPLKEQK